MSERYTEPLRAGFKDAVMRVDTLGWGAFLEKWDSEAVIKVRNTVLRYGLYAYSDAQGLDRLLRDAGVDMPRDAFLGGLSFPPRNDDEASAVDQRLASTRMLVQTTKRVHRTWPVGYEEEIIDAGTLFNVPAMEGDIRAAEERLGVTLPPSYKAFLRQTNGWLTKMCRLIPVGEAKRYRDVDTEELYLDWMDGDEYVTDERYFVYDESQDSLACRGRYIPDSLYVSSGLIEDRVKILLNPAVQFENGEWEVTQWDIRLPGMYRFRSFAALMEFMYMDDMRGLEYLARQRKETG